MDDDDDEPDQKPTFIDQNEEENDVDDEAES